MLFRTVLLPSALSSIPAAPEAAELFFPSAIRLLQDLAENCVLLIDNRRKGYLLLGFAALHVAIEKWPEKFRIPASKAIQILEKRRRIVVVNEKYDTCDGCSLTDCQHAIGVTLSVAGKTPVVVIAGGSCVGCCAKALGGRGVVAVGDYPASDFLRERSDGRVLLLSDGEWHRDRFESDVLVPIFRDAEVIKLYDRQIARNILSRDEAARPGPITCSLPENYKTTLMWIADVFARVSSSSAKKIEIYTTVDTSYMGNPQIAAVVKAVEAFVEEAAASAGLRPSLFLKTETKHQKMPHGRYLVTDRIGFLLERGFDLLWDDKTMQLAKLDPSKDRRPVRDVMISLCPYTERIESTTNKLQTLKIVK